MRKGYESFKRGDLDAAVESLDDDVVLRTAEGWPERAYYGKDAVRSFFEGIAETVGGGSVIEHLVDAGDSVVMRVRMQMTGERSDWREICSSARS